MTRDTHSTAPGAGTICGNEDDGSGSGDDGDGDDVDCLLSPDGMHAKPVARTGSHGMRSRR